jgi:hypothetical protein
MLTPRRFVLLLAGLGFGTFAFACSSDPAAVPATEADAGAADEDAGAAVTEDSGKDATGEACDSVKLPCTTGFKCLTISGTGGYCARKCAKAADCGSTTFSCTSGVCIEKCKASSSTNTCSNKSRMVCQGDLCVPNCALDSTVCAAPDKCETFDDIRTGYCVPPLNLGDAGSDAGSCQTPTTTVASGVTTTKTIGTLTDGEKGLLCDWSTGRYGGYGCKTACDGGLSYTNKADQTACKAGFKSTCPATVAQAEECIRQDSVNRCAGKIFNDPVCAPMRQTGCL